MTLFIIISSTIGYCLPGSTRPDYSHRSSKRTRSHHSSSYSPVATVHRTAAANIAAVGPAAIHLDCTTDHCSSTAAESPLHNTAANRMPATTEETLRIHLHCLEGYTLLPDSKFQPRHPASCQYLPWLCHAKTCRKMIARALQQPATETAMPATETGFVRKQVDYFKL